MAGQRISRGNLGAWVLKCNPRVSDLAALLEDGGRSVDSWCVADNYRSQLFEAGQPLLFWVSGPASGSPTPGIWATGQVTGPVQRPDLAATTGGGRRPTGKPVVPIEVAFLDEPVPRTELASHAALRDLEVIRQPQMSNPSFVTLAELAVLATLLPEPGSFTE